MSIATFNQLERTVGVLPPFHNVPVKNGTKTLAELSVEQEEWHYFNGNDKTDVTMENCYPWEELSRKAIDCPNKCLPVIFQYLWKEKFNRPRCLNGTDHMCMKENIVKKVRKIYF